MTSSTRGSVVVRLRAVWRALGGANRRRIVLGTLVAASLAFRDVMLLFTASSLFALGELGGAPVRRPALPS